MDWGCKKLLLLGTWNVGDFAMSAFGRLPEKREGKGADGKSEQAYQRHWGGEGGGRSFHQRPLRHQIFLTSVCTAIKRVCLTFSASAQRCIASLAPKEQASKSTLHHSSSVLINHFLFQCPFRSKQNPLDVFAILYLRLPSAPPRCGGGGCHSDHVLYAPGPVVQRRLLAAGRSGVRTGGESGGGSSSVGV